MKNAQNTDELITRFLLGELPEAERDRLEQQYFSDPEYFERICEVENVLIDRYSRGRLSGKERERFEKNYLITPARRQKVAFTKSLARASSQAQTADVVAREVSRDLPPTWWQSLLAGLRRPTLVAQLSMAVALILLIGGLWAVIQMSNMRRQLIASNQQRSELEQRERELERQIAEGRAQSDELAKELERVRQQERELEDQLNQPRTLIPSAPSVASFILLPGEERGGTTERTQTLRLAPGTDFVRLEVRFDRSDYPSYGAQVRTAEGVQVLNQKGLKARPIKDGAAVSVRMPANRLNRGDYLLTLSGVGQSGQSEEMERYSFRIEKK